MFNFLKNTIVIIATFFFAGTIIQGLFNFRQVEETIIGAVSSTIITVFIYSKIAKKFNL